MKLLEPFLMFNIKIKDANNCEVQRAVSLSNILAPKLIGSVLKQVKCFGTNDGEIKIYVENELVGEWRKCSYKLKRNYGELDRKKQLYLEMTVDFWTIFDQEELNNE